MPLAKSTGIRVVSPVGHFARGSFRRVVLPLFGGGSIRPYEGSHFTLESFNPNYIFLREGQTGRMGKMGNGMYG